MPASVALQRTGWQRSREVGTALKPAGRTITERSDGPLPRPPTTFTLTAPHCSSARGSPLCFIGKAGLWGQTGLAAHSPAKSRSVPRCAWLQSPCGRKALEKKARLLGVCEHAVEGRPQTSGVILRALPRMTWGTWASHFTSPASVYPSVKCSRVLCRASPRLVLAEANPK